ncbi:hypothetical protein Salat_2124100 [Sesamum alatum]|uniref:B3 domain-containing protein n=1 Tax=Sesamum alatum TaxID=300844 RepID=A0AAE1Y0Z9_9LAMI|nr:hypothetical protein Salat_2124100 [Sesamum alatum]
MSMLHEEMMIGLFKNLIIKGVIMIREGEISEEEASVDQEPEPPIPSLEEIPRLLEIIQSTNGTNPVFLYRKRLENSDIQPHQNRLFLTRCEKLMEFLTEEERNAVNGRKEGIEVFAVDSHDKQELYKLHLVRWPSLKMIVINSDWKKIVDNNRPRAGDWVEIWGYRRNGQLHFAVNFKKGAEAQSNASASSSNGGNGTSTN